MYCRLPLPLKRSCLVLAMVLSFSVQAQLANYKYITYTTNEELANNSVVNMCTDKTGALWIATRNGLSHYDGSSFKNYYYLPGNNGSLRSNWVTDVVTDSSGTVWVSTEWGLCYYDAVQDGFNYVAPKNAFSILYKAPLLYNGGSTIWMATEKGLIQVDIRKKTGQPTALTTLPDPQCIAMDANGCIWVGTRGNGIYLYNTHNHTSKRVQFSNFPQDAHIMGMYQDGKALWAATSEGLLKIINEQQAQLFDRFEKQAENKRAYRLTCAAAFAPITGDSLLICGTYDKKLLLFNKKTGLFVSEITHTGNKLYEMPNGIVNSLCAASNILWIGTDAGLCKLNTSQQNLNTYLLTESRSGGLNKGLVKNIVASGTNPQTCWLVQSNPGRLVQYDLAGNKELKSILGPEDEVNYIKLLPGTQQDWWVVRQQSVAHYNTKGSLLRLYLGRGRFYSATFDDQQCIWIGTDSGLAKLDTRTGSWHYYYGNFSGTQVENQSYNQPFPVVDVLYAGGRQLWLACIKYGLFRFDWNDQTFTAYRQPFTTAYETKNRCSSLAIDTSGNLWVGTMAGITRFNMLTQRFTNYNRSNGLLSSYVYSIQRCGNGNIWGRGNAGVFCYQAGTNKFYNYNLPTAFSNNLIFQQVSVVGKEVYVGFDGGFARFSAPLQQALPPPPVRITGVEVLNQPLKLNLDSATAINLSHRQNIVAIHFAAVDFSDEPATYEYLLEGTDKQWVSVGKNHSVLFSSLQPGNYLFKVRSRSDGGVGPSSSFRFVVQPPFWRTPLFLLTAIALVLLLAAAIIYRQFRKIKRRERDNLLRVKEHAELEMKALRSQMNPHFIFNALNSIHNYIWENQQEAASEYLVKFSKLMRLVLENSQHNLITLEEELKALELYMELEHRRTGNKFDYAITICSGVDKTALQIPPLLLQPYVENAIWHGLSEKEGKGFLEVKVEIKDGLLHCVVDDNGIGREATGGKQKLLFKKMSLGSNISSARIQWLKQYTDATAALQIVDKQQNGLALGTTVIITLPLILKED
jgi:ligand-binding sensor domain-containing protein